MAVFFKYTKPEKKPGPLTRAFNRVKAGAHFTAASARITARTLKFTFNAAALALLGASAVYMSPAERLPEKTPEVITQNLAAYKQAVRDFAADHKDKTMRTQRLIPDFLITSGELWEASKLSEENRTRFFSYATANGRDGAEALYLNDDLVWKTTCTGIADKGRLTKDQQEIHNTLKIMRMSPTARAFIDHARDKNVHFCKRDLGETTNANYQHDYYVINVQENDPDTLAHELSHHWQGRHNIFYSFRDDMSYEQAFAMNLSFEAAAQAIGALVNKEIEIARQIGGEGYEASFEEIQNEYGLGQIRKLMAAEYEKYLGERWWLDHYLKDYREDKGNKDFPAVNDRKKEAQLKTLDMPMIGETFGHGNFLTPALVDKTFAVARQELARPAEVKVPAPIPVIGS